MKKILRWLLNPIVILLAGKLGIFIGHNYPDLTASLIPFNQFFFALIQMCILPMLMTVIITGFARVFQADEALFYIKKMLKIFGMGLLLTSILGAATGVIFNVGGNLNDSSQQVIGSLLSTAEADNNTVVSTTVNPLATHHGELYQFAEQMIPKNIIKALVQENYLGILFFSIVLGISLGLLPTRSTNTALSVFDELNKAFLQIINAVIYLLPFAIVCLFAEEASKVNSSLLIALGKLILFIYIIEIVLTLFYMLIISWRCNMSYINTLLSLKRTMVVAFATTSSFATLPFAIEEMVTKFNLDKDRIDFIWPLGIFLNKQGSTCAYALLGTFLAHLYHYHLTPESIVIIIIGAIVTAIAGGGTPVLASLAMMSIMLHPLGLPVSTAIIIFSPIAPIIDPIMTILNVQSNCLVSALLAQTKPEKITEVMAT